MAISYIETTPEAADPTPGLPGPPVPTGPVSAAVTIAAGIALLVGDMIAPVPILAPSMRGLVLVAILAAAVIGSTAWIDRRQMKRHLEQVAMMDTRLRAACCAEAYVAGLARAPFPGQSRA